jgi:hypothetical protein
MQAVPYSAVHLCTAIVILHTVSMHIVQMQNFDRALHSTVQYSTAYVDDFNTAIKQYT